MKIVLKKLNNNKKFFLGIILGIILFGTTVYASQYILASNEVSYDKTSSGLTSDNVQDAIDELNTKADNMWCKSGYIKTDITGGYQCTPLGFNEATPWEDVIAGIQDGTITPTVGDTKTVDLGSTLGTHTLRVANTTTPAECSTTGFSQTACGLVLEFEDIITTHVMNSDYDDNGWPASDMRTYVNSDIYNTLPTALKNAIIDTIVVSRDGSDDYMFNFTSTDKLYLLSTYEVWDAEDINTRQLDYYAGQNVTSSNYSGAIKQYNGSNTIWWLRSNYSGAPSCFDFVTTSGGSNRKVALDPSGVSPAFRIA